MRDSDINKTGGLIPWCKAKYPMIKIENASEIKFTESLMESELLICDYYGSSHLEALMLEKPFVMFEGVKIIGINPDIKEFLHSFEEFGVYKKTGKELAEQIVNHKDYNVWLSDNNLQKCYSEYLNRLTSANQNLVELWAEEFNKD